jgi:hypothetical protein
LSKRERQDRLDAAFCFGGLDSGGLLQPSLHGMTRPDHILQLMTHVNCIRLKVQRNHRLSTLFQLCCGLFTFKYQVRISVRDVQVERERMRGDEAKVTFLVDKRGYINAKEKSLRISSKMS